MMNNFFFFKQKTAYEMRISDWSSDVCSSDLVVLVLDGCGLGDAVGVVEDQPEVAQPANARLRAHGGQAHLDARVAQRALLGLAGLVVEVDLLVRAEIGRASCRERVCQYV